jgi:hypothetical protein
VSRSFFQKCIPVLEKEKRRQSQEQRRESDPKECNQKTVALFWSSSSSRVVSSILSRLVSSRRLLSNILLWMGIEPATPTQYKFQVKKKNIKFWWGLNLATATQYKFQVKKIKKFWWESNLRHPTYTNFNKIFFFLVDHFQHQVCPFTCNEEVEARGLFLSFRRSLGLCLFFVVAFVVFGL